MLYVPKAIEEIEHADVIPAGAKEENSYILELPYILAVLTLTAIA